MSRGGARVWGNDHPAALLTEKKVIRYRTLVRSGKSTVGQIAAKEGCSHGRISMAVRGETWRHLNEVAPPVPAVQRRPAAKTVVAKKTVTRKAVARKTVAKAPFARKPLAKKALAKKALAKTTVAKRTLGRTPRH